MATGIKSWSSTAADNDDADANINWLENQAPSTVNNSARAMMAAIRDQYVQTEWRDWGHTVTQASATTFTIGADVTSIYTAGRAIKCVDSSTLYGTVTSSSFSSPDTTVTVSLDSGSLSGSLSSVELGPEVTNPSIVLDSLRWDGNDGQVMSISAGGTGRSAWAPKGHISGLVLSNDTDTDHDINITAGEATDSTQGYVLKLTSEMTKQIDATWAAGNDAGGMFTGSVANSTWYYVHLIRKDSDGSIDAGFDTSATAANIPTGYTAYRRIGAVLTNGSANILSFRQVDDIFWWDIPVNFFSSTTLATTQTALTVQAPPVVDEVGVLFYAHADSSTTNQYILFTYPGQTDTAPTSTVNNLASNIGGGSFTSPPFPVNSSSQIYYRASNATWNRGANFITIGYQDLRGK